MLTPKQLEARRTYLGASEVAAVLGVSPYRTAYDVWAEKTGRVQPEDLSGNDAVTIGTYGEAGVVQWFADRTGLAVETDPEALEIQHPEHDWWVAHPDGLVTTAEGMVIPLEAKIGSDDPDRWGPAGSDRVPWDAICQSYYQAIAMNAKRAYIAAWLFGGFGARRCVVYSIVIDPKVAAKIIDRCREFWACVVDDVAPVNSQPSDGLAARAKPKAGAVTISADLPHRYADLGRAIADLSKERDAVRAEMERVLVDATAAVYESVAEENPLCYGYQQTEPKSVIDLDRLGEREPELHERLVSEYGAMKSQTRFYCGKRADRVLDPAYVERLTGKALVPTKKG